jgi:hypothetical protein
MRPLLLLATLAVTAFGAGALEAQTPPSGPPSPPTNPLKEALRSLGQQIDGALAGPTYSGLDPLERRTVLILAVNAVMIMEAGQCSDPSAQGSAAESFLFTYVGIGRKQMQPVVDLPAARKAELLDKALNLASQQPPDANRVDALCRGKVLSAPSVRPIAEQQALARQVMSLALSPPPRTDPPPRPSEASQAPSQSPPSGQSAVPH